MFQRGLGLAQGFDLLLPLAREPCLLVSGLGNLNDLLLTLGSEPSLLIVRLGKGGDFLIQGVTARCQGRLLLFQCGLGLAQGFDLLLPVGGKPRLLVPGLGKQAILVLPLGGYSGLLVARLSQSGDLLIQRCHGLIQSFDLVLPFSRQPGLLVPRLGHGLDSPPKHLMPVMHEQGMSGSRMVAFGQVDAAIPTRREESFDVVQQGAVAHADNRLQQDAQPQYAGVVEESSGAFEYGQGG